jgi:hypothetical protein
MAFGGVLPQNSWWNAVLGIHFHYLQLEFRISHRAGGSGPVAARYIVWLRGVVGRIVRGPRDIRKSHDYLV